MAGSLIYSYMLGLWSCGWQSDIYIYVGLCSHVAGSRIYVGFCGHVTDSQIAMSGFV